MSLRELGLSKAFSRGRGDSREISTIFGFSRNSGDPGRSSSAVTSTLHDGSVSPFASRFSVPRCTPFDARVGASGINAKRKKHDDTTTARKIEGPPDPIEVEAAGRNGSHELNALLDHAYSAPSALPDNDAVLQRIAGHVVGTAFDDIGRAAHQLSDISTKMLSRGGHVSASFFRLLQSIVTRTPYASDQFRDVEWLTVATLSRAVKEMDRREEADAGWGRMSHLGVAADRRTLTDIDDKHDEAWESALECGVFLLTDASVRHVATHDAPYTSGDGPRIGIDRRRAALELHALVALTRHILPRTHPRIERVLVGESVWHGFRGSFEEDDDVIRSNVDEDAVYASHGGIQAIIDLYIRVRSLVARRRMFALILEVAVSRVRSRAANAGDSELVASPEQVNWLYGLLRANDAGDAFVPLFRSGPDSSFVMDVVRHLLFEPLSASSAGSNILAAAQRTSQQLESARDDAWPNDYSGGAHLQSGLDLNSRTVTAAHAHRDGVVVANGLLHKRFVLSTLMQLETMARTSARQFQDRPLHVETTAAEEIEAKLCDFRRDGRSGTLRSSRPIWQGLLPLVQNFVRLDRSEADIITTIENMFSVLLLPMPFASSLSESVDTEAEALLAGERRMLAHSTSAESAELLVLMLHMSSTCRPGDYVSELRQGLLEYLGASPAKGYLVEQFANDEDAYVAYRARVITAAVRDIGVDE